MKLIKFTFHDRIKNWGFTDLKFDDINLFIGASGVGKSLILEAVDLLKQVLVREELKYETSKVEWELDFEFGGNQYNWKVKFEKITNNINESKEYGNLKINFELENIFRNKELLLKRENGDVLFKGEKFPIKLQSNSSLFELITEDEVERIANEIKKISFNDFTLQNIEYDDLAYHSAYSNNIDLIDSLVGQGLSLESIKSKDWNVLFKLYVVSRFYPDLFKEITSIYSAIFPNVSHLYFGLSPKPILTSNNKFRELNVLYYQENGVKLSLQGTSFSSGMYRTLIHICELYLSPKGTVFLYDEFENSLGINCIDEITDLILSSENEYQFILTSHHPYIINNIPAEYWKLVTRHGGEVKISNVYEERIIDKNSKHEVFTQLMQSSKFKNGW